MKMKFRKNTEAALKFIEDVFSKHHLERVYMGGFDAKMYGATRPLADIDVYVREEKLPMLAEEFKKYIVFGPKRYKDRNWDLQMFTFIYDGQVVDICGDESVKIFDEPDKKWIKPPTGFEKYTEAEIFGRKIKLITEPDLIKYKTFLHRRVDVSDVKEMKVVMTEKV
ncbi:MAG: hypothetical protein PHV42_00260 [Candidatus Pacebacteria bacterium]|nr:hypothetical protein [Candidatus Paceibacterota bacterium]